MRLSLSSWRLSSTVFQKFHSNCLLLELAYCYSYCPFVIAPCLNWQCCLLLDILSIHLVQSPIHQDLHTILLLKWLPPEISKFPCRPKASILHSLPHYICIYTVDSTVYTLPIIIISAHPWWQHPFCLPFVHHQHLIPTTISAHPWWQRPLLIFFRPSHLKTFLLHFLRPTWKELSLTLDRWPSQR